MVLSRRLAGRAGSVQGCLSAVFTHPFLLSPHPPWWFRMLSILRCQAGRPVSSTESGPGLSLFSSVFILLPGVGVTGGCGTHKAVRALSMVPCNVWSLHIKPCEMINHPFHLINEKMVLEKLEDLLKNHACPTPGRSLYWISKFSPAFTSALVGRWNIWEPVHDSVTPCSEGLCPHHDIEAIS